METIDFIRALDKERIRQGMTKAQLADRCGMLKTSVRRLFSTKNPDVKLSTLVKISKALSTTIEIVKFDDGYDELQSRHALNRLRRMRFSERLAKRSGLDAGDIEHSLYNLSLKPAERLERGLHRG